MTTPQNDLILARTELESARDACPHWDHESDGEWHDADGGWRECCYRVSDAKRDLRKARRKFEKQS